MAPFTSFIIASLLLINHTNAFNIYNENDYKPKNFENISTVCMQQYNASDLMTLLQLFDASVKIPVGIGNGNFYQLGNFDECMNLETETAIGTIYGKYCLGTIPLANLATFANVANIIGIKPRVLDSSAETFGPHLAYCIPNKCTAEDLEEMTFGIVAVNEKFCQSKASRPELTSGAIATIAVLAVFFGIVIVSTAYDVLLYYLEKKPQHELLVSFSAFSNGKKLISASPNHDQLLCLNGIKSLSMMWVIIGHLYNMLISSPVENLFDVATFEEDAANMFIMGATVSVDTFFAVGGMVTVYSFLKAADRGVKFNIFMYYIHRYLRLTPAFAIVILIYVNLFEFLGEGPLWHGPVSTMTTYCQQYWWSALLYIQNFVNVNEMCVGQSWYLMVDIQIFLLSPIVLLPLKWKPKIGLSILAVLIAAGAIIPFVIGYVYEIQAFMTLNNDADHAKDMNSKYYTQTHTRFGPYVIGMLAGYFIYKLKKHNTKINLHPILIIAIWLVTLTGLVTCVYSYHDHMKYDRWGHSLALAFLRNAWGICVCAVVFMCVFGHGGIINWFLSLPLFQFLSKLSYCMYLTHGVIIATRYATMKYSFVFSNALMFWSFWGDFMFTLGVSLILCLTFESPVVILEKHIFKLGGNKTTKETATKAETS